MSRNLHKERFSCRFSIGSNFFAIRTAGEHGAVSWRCDQHVHFVDNLPKAHGQHEPGLMWQLSSSAKAFLVSHLEQTGGTMTVYKSSASAAVASIDVKGQVVNVKWLKDCKVKRCWAALTCFLSQGGGVISVAAWFIDGGIFHIEDCKTNSFLMEAHEGARLHATQFSAASCSAAGMLISNGEVTMRASVK